MGFLTAHLGFACDSVINYEVVLANGDVVEANRAENPDLFRALKGGGSNFDIVTRFDFKTHPVRDVYGGLLFIPWSYREELADQMIEVISKIEENPNDGQFIMYMYHAGAPEPLMGNMIMNLEGRNDTLPNRGLDDMEIQMDMRSHTTLAEFTDTMREPGGALYVHP